MFGKFAKMKQIILFVVSIQHLLVYVVSVMHFQIVTYYSI